MSVSGNETLEQLEREFLSGKNPKAYLPLCTMLRKRRQYERAMEYCLRGLSVDESSVAGKTMHARLLIDMGHYGDALKMIEKLEAKGDGGLRLLVEKARALIHLNQLDIAAELIMQLSQQFMLDPNVQMLQSQLRQARESVKTVRPKEVSENKLEIKRSPEEIAALLLSQTKSLATGLSVAVIPTGVGETALEGNVAIAEAGFDFYKSNSQALGELDMGKMKISFIETTLQQLIILVRPQHIVVFSMDPTNQFGKVLHRLQMAVSQLLPDAKPTNSSSGDDI